MEVPDGGLQVLRGPRPPAERWPMVLRGGGRQKEPQRRAQRRDQPKFQERVSRNPNEAISEARGRVGKLELAINALGGRPCSDKVEGGFSARHNCRHKCARWTIASRPRRCSSRGRGNEWIRFEKRSITKAQEAVLEAQTKLAGKEEELEEELKRRNSLQQEADGLSEQPPPLAVPDFARELAELRACVQPLQVERDDLRAEVARQNVEGRPRNVKSLAVPSPDFVMGIPCNSGLPATHPV